MRENKKNLKQAFLEAGGRFQERTLFLDEAGQGKTYGRFIEEAKAIAGYLVKSGIRPGARAAIVAPSGPAWCAAFAGAVIAGAIAVPLNETLPPEELGAILRDAAPEALFVGGGTGHLARLAEGALVMDFDSPGYAEKVLTPQNIMDAYPEQAASAPAVIVYTSGTTAMPKGVVLTNGNLLADIEAVLETGVVQEGESLLAPLPLYHAYPLMCSFLVPFIAGASIGFLPSIKELQPVAKAIKPGIIIAVPRMLELLWGSMRQRIPAPLVPLLAFSRLLRETLGVNAGRLLFKKAHSALGGRVRILASGGARLDPEVMRGLEGLGFSVVEGYGLSETSPVVTFNPLRKRKPGSAGRPLSSAEIRIEDEEVLIRGPMLMKGYWHRPEETQKVIKEGWLYTGDTGYIDPEGYLFITGRKKELIVLSSGKNIQPDEAERNYAGVELIKEIAVYEEGGALKALIVPDFELARAEKIANLREAIGWKLGEASLALPAPMRLTGFTLTQGPLPRTPLGKIKRYRLEELAKRGEALRERKKEDAALQSDPVGRKVLHAISLVMKEKEKRPIQRADNLELDLGLDSLGRVELLAALEEALSLRLPDDFLFDIQGVGELVEKAKGLVTGVAGVAGGMGVAEEEPAATGREREKQKQKQKNFFWQRAAHGFFVCLVRGLMKAAFRVEAAGLENIPPKGPYILAANHASFLDGFVLAGVLPAGVLRGLYFQGYERYFRGAVSFLSESLHVIPIDREMHLGSALRRSAEKLKEGAALCIFPEGGRSFDGRLMELKPGIAALAMREVVPIVPAWIEGTWRALPRGAIMPRLVKVRVRVGKVIQPGDFETAEGLLEALRDALTGLSRGEG